MASKVAKFAVNKVAGGQAKKYEPPDPHYENYTDQRGRTKKRVRAMPPGLTPQEQKTLAKIRRRAHRMDKGFSLCGFRVGYTFLIGWIPLAGDATNLVLGVGLISQAKKVDIPDNLASKMKVNTLIASGAGLVPFVGDIVYAAIKPNSRNAMLFEDFLVERAKSRGATTGLDSGAAEAQGQQVIDRAQGGKWSRRTGENNALNVQDGLETEDPARAYQGGSHQPQMTTAHQVQQPSTVKVAPPPVPPRP